jgi:uncharacterized membrane protein YhaH (DUF805 family)
LSLNPRLSAFCYLSSQEKARGHQVGLFSLLFSFHGRINRSQYWSGTLGLSGANVVFFMMTSFSQVSSAMTFKTNPAEAVSHAMSMAGPHAVG